MKWWAYILYQFLFGVGFLIALPSYVIKMVRRGKSGRGFGQRFGIYGPKTRQRIQNCKAGLWIHAVSVGEVNLAILLIKEIQQRWPKLPIVLSVTTPTGQAVALKQIPREVVVIYNPLDFFWSVKTFFRLLQPRLLILVESEIWPNYFWEARKRKIPIVMVNARLSKKTEARYHKWAWFCQPLLQQLEKVCVQCEEDKERFIRLGIEPFRVVVTGSMKYDVSHIEIENRQEIKTILHQAGWNEREPIFLAGSTHPGEELVTARVFQRLTEQFPNLFFVLAPRHAERGGEISRLLKEQGLEHKRRSKLKQPHYEKNRVLLLDSTGELKYFYPFSSATFIGKSLKGRGGQNFLEAIQAGCPVIFGPHMENFALMAREFLKHQAVIAIQNESDLEKAVTWCLNEPEKIKQLKEQALRLFESRLGATTATVSIIEPWIKKL
jgi:3-deoxy-D-manno-octulosonic-acid transferase